MKDAKQLNDIEMSLIFFTYFLLLNVTEKGKLKSCAPIRTPVNTDNGHFSVSRVTKLSYIVNPTLRTLVICALSIFIVAIMC